MMENIRDEWKPREVLLGIHRCGGEGTTPEITEMTDLDGQQIRYQLRRNLEPAGYVVTEQPESEGGVTPPKRMRLTDQGETMAEQIVDDRDGEHTIESTLSAVGDEIEELTARLGALENQVSDEGLKAEMNTLRDDLDAVSSAVGEIQGAKYGALSDEAVEEIATLKAGHSAFIELASEELDMEGELIELLKQEQDRVDDEMGLSDD